jgi:hypothetical protein
MYCQVIQPGILLYPKNFPNKSIGISIDSILLVINNRWAQHQIFLTSISDIRHRHCPLQYRTKIVGLQAFRKVYSRDPNPDPAFKLNLDPNP